jgi:hypothetical protein
VGVLIGIVLHKTRGVLEDRWRMEAGTDPDTKSYAFTMHRVTYGADFEAILKQKELLVAIREVVPRHENNPDRWKESNDEVLKHIAGLIVYWKISSNRYIDNVPQEIRYHLLRGLAVLVKVELSHQWSSLTMEEQKAWLENSPEEQRRLQRLQEDLVKLTELRKVWSVQLRRSCSSVLFNSLYDSLRLQDLGLLLAMPHRELH